MHPELINIGGFPLRSFGILIALGFVIAAFIARARAPRYGIKPDKIWDLSFWLMIFGVLGARVTFIALNWSYFAQNPSELYSIQLEGLTSFGGIIAGAITTIVFCIKQRIPILALLDTLGMPVLVAHAIGRVGCFLNGCCFGEHVHEGFPLGVKFQNVDGLRHPTQIYDTVMCLLGVVLLVFLERRKKLVPGQSISLFFIIYCGSRFIHEIWRDKMTEATRVGGSFITGAQLASLIIAAIALGFYWWFGRKASDKKELRYSS